MKALGLWSHAFLRQNDPLINGEKISSREEKQRRLHSQFFWQHCYCFWDVDPLPRGSHGLHRNETRAWYLLQDHTFLQERKGAFEPGRGRKRRRKNKLLTEITCLSTFKHALRTWVEHLSGVTETTYGYVVQNKRSCKSWCCSLQVITRPRGKERNKGHFRINIPS